RLWRSGGMAVGGGRATCRLAGLLIPLAMLAGLAGCRSSSPTLYVVPVTPSEDRPKYIAMAYMDALQGPKGPPHHVNDLKPYLERHGNVDELLVSPSDGQPFVIIWGKQLSGGPTDYKGLFPILAYEKKGSGGQRAVTDIRGVCMTVPEEDFPKLKFL